MNATTNDYLEVVRQLPPPTLAQTERFARYVSCAHSWYKHLPIQPKVPFVFFLDPGAGMNYAYTATGEAALVEITDERTRFHYTWQKTENYRRRFGCWNYQANYGTSFLYAGEGGMVSTAGPGLRILTHVGGWVGVPPDLAEKGTALVNALVHPWPNFTIWEHNPAKFGLPTGPPATNFLLGHLWNIFGLPKSGPLSTDFLLGHLWNILQQGRHAWKDSLESIPPQILTGIEEPVSIEVLRSKLRPLMGGWDWPDDGLLEELRAAGVEAGRIPSVVKHIEIEMMRPWVVWTNRQWKQGTPECPSRGMVIEAILEERGGQLAAMTDAMNRFIAAVFLH